MQQGSIPKWQKEIEAMLREQYQGDELDKQLQRARELVALTEGVEVPRGDTGLVIGQMLKMASDEMTKQASVYVGFLLGVAWERYQNANGA